MFGSSVFEFNLIWSTIYLHQSAPHPPPFIPDQLEILLLSQDFLGERIVVVGVVHDGRDAGVEDHLGTDDAGEGVAVER